MISDEEEAAGREPQAGEKQYPSPLTPLPQGERGIAPGPSPPAPLPSSFETPAARAAQDEEGEAAPDLSPLTSPILRQAHDEGGEGEWGWRRPPVATRFKPGRSGNPRGRPKRKRHLGAVVAAALRERIAVEDTDGRVRRLSKLEATVKAIVDGAAKGDAPAVKLLFALIKADERSLTEAEGRDEFAGEADAIVIAELVRRLAAPQPALLVIPGTSPEDSLLSRTSPDPPSHPLPERPGG